MAPSAVALLALPLLLLLAPAAAKETYKARIPNADNVRYNGAAWPAVGHTTCVPRDPPDGPQLSLACAIDSNQWKSRSARSGFRQKNLRRLSQLCLLARAFCPLVRATPTRFE